jgi:sigma-70-like protein
MDRFMPFARKLAVRYIHGREPLDDLMQVACIGPLNAIDRFDPVHGKNSRRLPRRRSWASSSVTSATRDGRSTSRAISRNGRWR